MERIPIASEAPIHYSSKLGLPGGQRYDLWGRRPMLDRVGSHHSSTPGCGSPNDFAARKIRIHEALDVLVHGASLPGIMIHQPGFTLEVADYSQQGRPVASGGRAESAT